MVSSRDYTLGLVFDRDWDGELVEVDRCDRLDGDTDLFLGWKGFDGNSDDGLNVEQEFVTLSG